MNKSAGMWTVLILFFVGLFDCAPMSNWQSSTNSTNEEFPFDYSASAAIDATTTAESISRGFSTSTQDNSFHDENGSSTQSSYSTTKTENISSKAEEPIIQGTTVTSTIQSLAATTNAPAIRLDTEVIADEILRLLNEERAVLGRCRLSTAPIAHEIAVARAKELQVLWSHYRPDGSAASTIYTEYQYGVINGEIGVPDGNGGWTLVDAYGPAYGSENISNGTTYRAEATNTGIAQSIVEGFKGSPGHWKDLMKAEYSGVGIGVSITDDPCSDFYVDNCAVLTMDKTYG